MYLGSSSDLWILAPSHLPKNNLSGILKVRSPITAAGPFVNCTRFSFNLIKVQEPKQGIFSFAL